MKKTVKKNVKSLSFHQLCEAIERGDKTVLESLDFDVTAPSEDADFSEAFGGDDTPVEDDTEGAADDTEGAADETPAKVTVEIDPAGSLVDALHAIIDVLEGDADAPVEDDTTDASEDAPVEDDTESEDDGDAPVEDDTESEDEEMVEEDEELAASAPAAGVHVADKMKATERKKGTPAVNRKPVADDDIELAPHTEGEAAGTKPTERKKHTPAINRSATANSRLTPTKRITNVGK